MKLRNLRNLRNLKKLKKIKKVEKIVGQIASLKVQEVISPNIGHLMR